MPTLFTAISNAAEAGGRDLSFIKFCVSGGAALSAEVKERFERIAEPDPGGLWPERDLAGGLLHADRPGEAGQRGAGGAGHGHRNPRPGQSGALLPQGERGEICVRGPQVMLGYYNQPEETAHVFTDGAFRTGDIGYLDEDGCLFIVDRLKDVIICGGFKVYPRVIEEAAYQHPAVQDAVAIGIPDAYRGQSPKLL